jgi:DNA-binding transcriptional ArsR family regulator
MAELELVAPEKRISVAFGLEPAYSGLTSMILLGKNKSGMGEWVSQTAAIMTPEQLHNNRLACSSAAAHFDGVDWPSFPAWVDDLAARDPVAMRDQDLAALLTKAARFLGDAGLPSADHLLDDRTNYLEFVKRLLERKSPGAEFNREHYEEVFGLLQDPARRQELTVSHLRMVWDEHLAAEWERNRPMLEDSASAFESIDYGEMSGSEIVAQAMERDEMPSDWEEMLVGVEHYIVVPSAHIGPYVILMDVSGDTARIVTRARIPAGSSVTSPALSRSELIMRLSGLNDDTRLRILELLAREGEKDTKYIMAELGLSQSSASRHLGQLSATGYLVTHRSEGVKHYRLNQQRIEDTLIALKEFLR